MTNTTKTLGFLALFLISTGIMFKIFHWPYAGMILFSGFILLNLGFLPLAYFNSLKKENKLK